MAIGEIKFVKFSVWEFRVNGTPVCRIEEWADAGPGCKPFVFVGLRYGRQIALCARLRKCFDGEGWLSADAAERDIWSEITAFRQETGAEWDALVAAVDAVDAARPEPMRACAPRIVRNKADVTCFGCGHVGSNMRFVVGRDEVMFFCARCCVDADAWESQADVSRLIDFARGDDIGQFP